LSPHALGGKSPLDGGGGDESANVVSFGRGAPRERGFSTERGGMKFESVTSNFPGRLNLFGGAVFIQKGLGNGSCYWSGIERVKFAIVSQGTREEYRKVEEQVEKEMTERKLKYKRDISLNVITAPERTKISEFTIVGCAGK